MATDVTAHSIDVKSRVQQPISMTLAFNNYQQVILIYMQMSLGLKAQNMTVVWERIDYDMTAGLRT